MTRNYRTVLPAIACAAVLCACDDDDGVDVVAERADPNADFTAYKTFAFAEAQDGGTVNIPSGIAANLSTANNEIKTQLEALGLNEVDANASPDLFAFSLASTNEQAALSWTCVPGYWYGYWDWSYTPCSVVSPYYDEYTVGTLVVGLVDPALEKTVFGGVAQDVVDGTTDANDDIVDAVDDIFEDYPVDQTGN
jgi:hypothetical protein